METFDNTPIRFTDPHSGVEILQLVDGASRSTPLGYDWPSITPDHRWVVIDCRFAPGSGRPSGFYRVSTDGSELCYLCEGGIHPRLTPDGRSLYVLRSGSTVLRRVDMETGRCDDVCDLEPVLPEGYQFALMRLSAPSNYLYVLLREPDIIPIRVALSTGDAVRLHIDGMIWACMGDRPRIVVVRMAGAEKGRRYDYSEYRKLERSPGDRSLWSLNVDGGDERFLCADLYSHATMLGRTSRVQGCGKWGDRGITMCEEGKAARKICAGPYFWHSGASFDAAWIAADTNWPDYGIQLVHVPTGNFRFLCHAESSLKDGSVHPHPSLSDDGRIALFRSDRSGACQAYLVHIPEGFRDSVATGEPDDSVPVRFPH